jgi:Domain of unknown function (DUF4440)
MKKTKCCIVVSLFIGGFFSTTAVAQTEKEKVTSLIFHKDSLFWNAYNSCDIATFKEFITDDVEFYHDKGGITSGAADLAASIKNNLCSNSEYHLRREVVSGTVKIFPLQKGGIIYGAIFSGEHYFYLTEKDKKERRDGWAKFTHLWILTEGVWKMSRILSYDHAPAPYINTRKEVHLSNNKLKQFEGQYTGPISGTFTVQRKNSTLVLIDKNKQSILYSETGNLFFIKDRDLTFEFVKDGKKVSSIKIRDNGNLVEELKK